MAEEESPADPLALGEDVLRQLGAAERLMRAVDDALAAAGLPIRELTVAAAADGVVSLFGVTESEPARRRADEVARAVPGVARVLNTIIVLAEPGAAADRAGGTR
jgi:BON domain-containing protein